MDTDFAKATLVPILFRGLRVLLVDHDTTTLSDISSVLEQHFYTVTPTELATTALAVLHKGADRFDLVMADVNMTEMDVFAFLKVIQLLGDIPIILISSREDREMARKARAQGASIVFQKPISTEHLKNVWQHVHRKRRSPKVEAEKLDVEEDAEDGIVEEEDDKTFPKTIRAKYKIIETDQMKENIKCATMDWYGGKEGMNEEDVGNSGTKWCVRWTPDLHRQFKDVISAVGERACPKTVLQMMNVPNITPRQVASHLQKYRVQLKRAREAVARFDKYAENGNAFKQTYQQNNIMKFPVPVPQTLNSEKANAPGLQRPLFGSVSSHILNISDVGKYLKLIENPNGNSYIKF